MRRVVAKSFQRMKSFQRIMPRVMIGVLFVLEVAWIPIFGLCVCEVRTPGPMSARHTWGPVLHAGYVLQQCFDVALPAHIETLVGLWHRFPACKFFGRRPRAGRLGIEFRGAAKSRRGGP